MKPRTPIIVNILTVLLLLFIAFSVFAPDTGYLSSIYFWGTVVITVIMAFLHGAIGDLIENERFKRLSEDEKREYLIAKKTPFLKRTWQSAFKKQSAQEEKDIIIDHGFDGIMELDNQLPKWWLGLFWFGVIYCIVYIAAYFTTNFAHTDVEYEREYKAQIAAVDEYMATVPQATLETAKFSADNVAEGEQIFKTNCVSCHGEGGKGGIGPNLTDEYWINIQQEDLFHNIFWMVENGSPNNPAMRAFIKDGTLTGNDAEKVAAYVYHINQEVSPITPAQGGSEPQGEIAPWAQK